LIGGTVAVILCLLLFVTNRNWAKDGDAKVKIERELTAAKAKNEAKARTVAPFLEAAKVALEEGNRLDSGAEIGVSYQKHNDQLLEFATKVNKVAVEMNFVNIDTLIPGASEISKYLAESVAHWTSAANHWNKKIKKQDSPKTEKMLRLEWIAARSSLGIADNRLRLVILDQAQELNLVEDGNSSDLRERLNKDRLTQAAALTSSNHELEDLLKYGYSEIEVARMKAYLEEVVWKAKEWSKAKEQMVVDPKREPIERMIQRRRAAITAPLDALKDVLKVTEEAAQQKRQKADADLEVAKVRANQHPHEPDILKGAEEAHRRTNTQQNEAIEIIQIRIQEELKALNQ
jgi:hypothetical protein